MLLEGSTPLQVREAYPSSKHTPLSIHLTFIETVQCGGKFFVVSCLYTYVAVNDEPFLSPPPAADVLRLNSLPDNAKKDLTVSASFFEIYSGKVYDLLNKKVRLLILEDAKQQVQVSPNDYKGNIKVPKFILR